MIRCASINFLTKTTRGHTFSAGRPVIASGSFQMESTNRLKSSTALKIKLTKTKQKNQQY